MLRGVATGALEHVRDDWAQAIPAARMLSGQAVELTTNPRRLPALVQYLAARPTALSTFRYCSAHAPIAPPEHPEWERWLTVLAELPVQTLVFHPDALPDDHDQLRALGARLALENMDPRSASGRTADELEQALEPFPQARLVLDVAHARAVDPSGQLLEQLCQRWDGRLAHLHLSRIDGAGVHHPLGPEALAWLQQLPPAAGQVPWIWEQLPQW